MAQAQAEYPDGTHRDISYSLFSGNRKHAFSISSATGETHNNSVVFLNDVLQDVNSGLNYILL